MCVKSSNLKDDLFLVSCGNEDDPQVKIWSLKDQNTIAKYTSNNNVTRKPYYYLNVIYLNVNKADEDEYLDLNAEEDRVNKGFIIMAASIRGIDIYLKNPLSSEVLIDSRSTDGDIGSYLSCMTTIKHNDQQMSLLVGNVNGIVEIFNIKIEKPDFKGSQDLDNLSSNSGIESKDGKESKNTNENRLKMDSEIDVLDLIQKVRKGEKFAELEQEDVPAVHPVEPQEENPESDASNRESEAKPLDSIEEKKQGRDATGSKNKPLQEDPVEAPQDKRSKPEKLNLKDD